MTPSERPELSVRRPSYTDCEPDEVLEVWATMGVTALAPGWHNIFRGERPGELVIEAAPAVLHQELVETVQRRTTSRDDDPDSPVRVQTHTEAPRMTRLLFARHEKGRLSPAETSARTYLGACGPGEDPTKM